MKILRFHTLLLLLATILVMAAAAGCVEPMTDQSSAGQITFQISTEGVNLATKAGEDPAESMLYNLQIWAFTHDGDDTETAKAYYVSPDNFTACDLSTGNCSVTMEVPGSVVADLDNTLSFDFYVLGNGKQYSPSDPDQMKREDVKALIETDYPKTVPSTGLPMSGFDVAGFDASSLRRVPVIDNGNGPVITLTRAVSKVRFVFAKASDMTKDVKITGITFDQLPSASYLLPRDNGEEAVPDNTTYNDYNWDVKVIDEDIKRDADPLSLRRRISEEASDYNARLTNWVNEKLSTQKVIYLRESNRVLTGKISYMINNVQQPDAVFVFPNTENCFPRNTNFIVLGYFLKNPELKLSVVVLPWTKETTSINSSYSVNVDQDGRFYINPTLKSGDGTPIVTKSCIRTTTYKEGTKYYVINSEKNFELADPQPDSQEEIASGEYYIATSFDYDVNVTQDMVTGRVFIYAPEGGTLRVVPKSIKLKADGSVEEMGDDMDIISAFDIAVSPRKDGGTVMESLINGGDPTWGKIMVTVKPKENITIDSDKAITLSFEVEMDGRTINANSEIEDEKYRFIIKQ